jgi:hypothetical protein
VPQGPLRLRGLGMSAPPFDREEWRDVQRELGRLSRELHTLKTTTAIHTGFLVATYLWILWSQL